MNSKNVSYTEYIKVDEITSLQSPESQKAGQPVHDEMLFIIVHQVYELWFKQILTELKSVQTLFSSPTLDDKHFGVICQRLERVTKIQQLLLDQVGVLETMTPMDFLDFRDHLYPASGFQSYQFRLTENILGLDPSARLKYENQSYLNRLSPQHQNQVKTEADLPSIFELVERWLERTPFLKTQDFDFWAQYFSSVDSMLQKDFDLINQNPHLNAQAKEMQLKSFEKTKDSFNLIRSSQKLGELKEQGQWRLSHKATQAALFILLYRHQPALQLPYKLISLLCDIDENFTAWRYRHAQMALKMIGTKIGTGGSSGYEYLELAAKKHKIYFDFSRLATFLIPTQHLPKLPQSLEKKLTFSYGT
jgi:tryptophan 2,3-dioxygenase